MSEGRKLAVGVLLLGLTVPVACGGDDGEPSPTRAQFVSRADLVCKRLRELSRPIDRRLDRTSSPRKQLSLLRQRRSYQDGALTRLEGLDVPEADREAVARYISAMKKRRDLGRRLESALEREDLPAARATLLDGVEVNRAAFRAAIRLGFEQCERGRPASGRDVLDAFTPDVGVPIRIAADGTTLKLTVEAVIDPLAVEAVPQPDGARFVGIRLLIENTGEQSIDIPLAEEATLTTSADERLDPAFFGAGSECEESLNVATLSAGLERSGCIPFQIREGKKPKSFRFGGFGGDTAEWDLTSARPVSGDPSALR
jgi:uncharacterized protein DUF4352